MTPHPQFAVIPAAGRGTRLRPITDAIPKELVPLGDDVVLGLVLRELIDADYQEIVVVSDPQKRALNEYVDRFAETVAGIGVEVRLVWQAGGLGNGHAILSAGAAAPGRPLLVVWGDEVFLGSNRAREITDHYRRTGRTTIALTRVRDDDVKKCGIALASEADGHFLVRDLIEKPLPTVTDSRLASVGGYVLSPSALEALRCSDPSPDGELYLSTALTAEARDGRVDGVLLRSAWHEVGSRSGYRAAWRAVLDQDT